MLYKWSLPDQVKQLNIKNEIKVIRNRQLYPPLETILLQTDLNDELLRTYCMYLSITNTN